MKTILIDYGAGNLHSVHKALEKAGLVVTVSSNPALAATADTLVLPGQGHFRQVMEAFLASGFEPVVRQHIAEQKPFLGICVGLQLLMEASEEAPGLTGLGIIKGKVARFPEGLDSVPQMGWNQLRVQGKPALLEGVAEGAFVYFCNSYYVQFEEDLPGASSSYAGVSFKSAISNGPLNATQFHPEKSQQVGLMILQNFKRIAETHAICPA
jgi:imidazole glycerol-phosphate synthase subunit HisH